MSEPVSVLRIISIIIPVFAIAFTGWAYGRRRPTADMAFLNQMNMEIFKPALVFAQLANGTFDVLRYQGLAAGVLLMIAGSCLLGWWLARLVGSPAKVFVPAMMFNNCGNLGLPLAVLAFGEKALAPAVVMLLITSLVQFSFGNWLLDHHARWWNVWRIPVVLATIAGVAFSLTHQALWPPLESAIKILGDASIPIMLLGLGVRIARSRLTMVRIGVIGALARPAIGLLLTWGIAALLSLHGEPRAMLLIYGALPPAVVNYVFAEHYNQGPDEVAAIVIVGNIAALIIVPLALFMVL
jgi:predicted permease